MISTVAWVQKGIGKREPQFSRMDDGEYKRICDLMKDQLDIAKSELEEVSDITEQQEQESSERNKNADDELAEYNLDEYDEEIVEEPEIFAATSAGHGLTVFRDNDEDPYVTLKDEEMEKDENEELEIKETDSIVLVGKTEEEISHLEVYVYDVQTDSLYIHHDIMLPSFPLCIEPINFNVQDSRNWCAIGTFEPTIELWNLDIVDAIYPYMILGDSNNAKQEKERKKSKKKSKSEKTGHSGAVLALSWNHKAQIFLLSASADSTIILWDISNGNLVRTFSHHSDKVSCVKWHPLKPSVFISAGYDRKIYLVDAQLEEQPALTSIKLNSDIECLSWDMHTIKQQEDYGSIVVGCEDGEIYYVNVSKEQLTVALRISAGSSSLTSVEIHPHIPGLLLTTAAESSQTCQIWDLNIADKQATLISNKNIGAGKLYCGQFCPDDPYLCAFGGSAGLLSVWNITDTSALVKRFHGRPGQHGLVDMCLPHSLHGDKLMLEVKNGKDEQMMIAEGEDEGSGDDEAEMEEVLEEMRGIRK